jgi:cytochrome c biogenesis protein CcdA
MIVVAAIVCGAFLGAITAKNREGTGLDMAQYAAGYGIAFGLLGLFLSLLLRAIG